MSQIATVSLIILWMIVSFNLLLTLVLVRRLNQHTVNEQGELQEGLGSGEEAPDFSAETLQGETVTLADYSGHDVLFIFISSHCEDCREALPKYEALNSSAVSSDPELVLVSADSVAETRSFIEEFEITSTVLAAPYESNAFLKNYKVVSVPAYCLVDSQGKVQISGPMEPKWSSWSEMLELSRSSHS